MVVGPSADIQVIDAGAGAAALLHPLRRRILGSLQHPESATGLSRALGVPRQKINYHLRALERQSLVELVEERRKGNCTERVVRATARAYVIGPTALGALSADPERIRDRFSFAYLVAMAARVIGELAILRSRAEAEGKRLATLSLETDVRFKNAVDRAAFADELAHEVARLATKYHDPTASGGRTFRLFIGGYPALSRGAGATDPANPTQEQEETP